MTINKVSPRDYASVNPASVEEYIKSYYNSIGEIIYNNKYNKRLRDCNKAQLNQIAAELETAKKRLEYIIDGIY